MIDYKYKAVASSGKKITGIVQAYNEYEAAAKIKEEFPIIENLTEVRLNGKQKLDLNEPLWVNERNLALICSQVAILLRAGLPAARVVGIIAEQSSDRLLKRYLTETAADVEAGNPLSDSLKRNGKKLPPAFIEMIKAGEDSGTLEQSFDKLTLFFEKRCQVKGKVRGALIYPAMLTVLAVAVVILVINVAVPAISGVGVENGGQMPMPTLSLLYIYHFFERYGLVSFSVILVAACLYQFWKRNTRAGRRFRAKLQYRMPILGKLVKMNAASQFANTMATMLSAGIPIKKAADITAKVIDNCLVADSVAAATEKLEEGRSLGSVLAENPYLPSLLCEMAAVGEASGSLEETLSTIGIYYDQETERASAKVLSMLEPIITIVMGLCIGYIVIALYLPMFSMYGTV